MLRRLLFEVVCALGGLALIVVGMLVHEPGAVVAGCCAVVTPQLFRPPPPRDRIPLRDMRERDADS